MKKMFLLTAFLLGLVAANAQVRLGLKAGYNLTDVKMEAGVYYLKSLTYSKTPGFHAGVVMDVALGDHFSLQPGLLYTLRGFDTGGYGLGPSDGQVSVTAETRYHYLELPVNFLYKYTLGPGKLFAGAGPFLSYGISGRINGTYMGRANPEERLVFLDQERDYNAFLAHKQYLRPFNAGAGFTLGYECNAGILISVNYNLGLTDVEPRLDLSQKSRSWGISIGYLFNSGK